jgi:internalin A
MTDQAETVSRRWRRFLRFSVRGMIVAVLVIGGWLGWIVRSARIQREAVSAIQHAGGSVMYDWGRSNGKLIPGGEPWAPKWLVERIGRDYFGHVAAVTLSGSVGDEVMAHVGGLTSLSQLDLSNTDVTDVGLRHLSGLTKLTDLNLDYTRVTHVGLEHLEGLNELEVLGLNGTRITDAGLFHLRQLTKLQSLELWIASVTDAGLMHLKGLTLRQEARERRIISKCETFH